MRGFIFSFLLLSLGIVQSQTQIIKGFFPGHANQQVKITGFHGFDSYTIDSVNADDEGSYNLSFSQKDYGMGYLVAKDNKPFIVVLSGESVKLKGEKFAFPETIEIISGKENRLFGKYASEHPRREQALSAWYYLKKIYMQDSLFAVHNMPKQVILKEKQRIKAEDSLFLAGIDPDSYVSWYLPVRKLVSSVSTIAQYRTEEIPIAIAEFRKLDYSDPRLYKSGLLGDAIESHFWLIENSGRSLDSVYIEMEISIDRMIENQVSYKQNLNEISGYLFKFLEKRSLFPASEYLALKLLNDKSCTLNNDFASQLESYRAMKKGNIASDIVFNGDIYAPGFAQGNIPQSLSDVQNQYKVVVFGASWCPQCPGELQSIAQNYTKWKQYGLEVVFVSLDEDKESFKNFTSPFPFISTCDYQKWESPVVKSYHVFATPTIYLLDNKREIILRPNTVKQLDSWVDWYLVEGNK